MTAPSPRSQPPQPQSAAASNNAPDLAPLDLAQLQAQLVTSGLYPSVEVLSRTGSTNTDLMNREHLVDGTVLLAEEQTSGKGRLGRRWESPAYTQVIFSVAILPPTIERLGIVPLAVGVAIADVVPAAVLKWPNDVLVGGKKLCGILAEAQIHNSTPRVVVGAGINVSLSAEQLPVPHATSLALLGENTDRTQWAVAVLQALHRRLQQWRSDDPALMADYRAVCSSLGQQVRLEAPGGTVVGTVTAIADDGRIIVDGEAYSAGDIIHLRPAGGSD